MHDRRAARAQEAAGGAAVAVVPFGDTSVSAGRSKKFKFGECRPAVRARAGAVTGIDRV